MVSIILSSIVDSTTIRNNTSKENTPNTSKVLICHNTMQGAQNFYETASPAGNQNSSLLCDW